MIIGDFSMMFITDKALIQGNQVAIRNGSYSPTFFTNAGLNNVTVTASIVIIRVM